jgi:hypothetical protein
MYFERSGFYKVTISCLSENQRWVMIGIIKQRCLPVENLQNLGKKHTNVFIIRFKCAALPNKK